MVDFRYHLVSLISVFFALAIGIILGAGPLQNSIGNVLQGQVSDLRVTNENLKKKNADLTDAVTAQDRAFDDLAPSLVGGKLSGRKVAVVVFPGVKDANVADSRAKLELAGAKVTGQATITEAWTAASTTAFRSTFADQIRTYVPGAAADSDANTVLAQALNLLLREGTTQHATLAGLLTGTDKPMLSVDGLTDGADVVVAFAADSEPSTSSTPDPEAVAQQKYTTSTLAALVTELGTRGPAVAAGSANSDGDVVRVVRDAGGPVSTVDSIDRVIGHINVALAAASELKDQLVHFGLDAGAQGLIGTRSLIPPAEIPTPTPVPTQAPSQAPEEGNDAADPDTNNA
ncbi:copper transporter [Trueperella pyogenes]|uniref:copper transporter n=1 Tax=Trueperella pyogenes TaxID=1661 RepID=UPI000468899B|nr:copper transporter [Trueperella pyogenes]